MPILSQLLIGMAGISASVVLQALFMSAVLHWIVIHERRERGPMQRLCLTVAVVLWFFFAICVICWGWALLLRWLGALSTTEEALYFSTVTFTTLGYGDVVLEKRWRLLGTFVAANGTIIIGWITAMVFLAVQRLYAAHRR